MKLWYVMRDGRRYVYTNPRTGASDLTRKRGEEIGEKLLEQPNIERVELANEIGVIYWWMERSSRPRSRS
jgi:hypothetical protein